MLARTQFNQVQGLSVESCDISVATDNAIDAVAVQASTGCEPHVAHLGWAVNRQYAAETNTRHQLPTRQGNAT